MPTLPPATAPSHAQVGEQPLMSATRPPPNVREPRAQSDQSAQLFADKRREIESRLLRKDHAHRTFLPRSESQWPWIESDLEALFPTPCSAAERGKLLESYTTCLNILAYIEWPFDANVFRSLFFDRPGYADKDLPFSKPQVEQLGGGYPRLFESEQYYFQPCVITKRDRAGTESFDQHRPWPYLSDPDIVGSGSYGEVAKVEIAKGCLRRETPGGYLSNESSTPLAVKTFKKNRPEREVKSLDYLRESLTQHARISSHVAAVFHGEKLHIFYDYADLGDLETFLLGGQKMVAGSETIILVTKYVFQEKFPQWRPVNLLEELAGVASALKFLHEDLPSNTEEQVHCAHLDLTPSNILIFPSNNQEYTVGTWKITDFGISSFKHQNDNKVLPENLRTIRDLAGLETSGTNQKLTGAHRAPELHPEVRKLDRESNKPGRKADIWAFGCIANEVFAFFIGSLCGIHTNSAVENVTHFREEKKQGRLADSWFTLLDSAEGHRIPRLVPSVEKWLSRQSLGISGQSRSMNESIREITELLRSIFWIEANKRPLASEIVSKLQKISHSLTPESSLEDICERINPRLPSQRSDLSESRTASDSSETKHTASDVAITTQLYGVGPSTLDKRRQSTISVDQTQGLSRDTPTVASNSHTTQDQRYNSHTQNPFSNHRESLTATPETPPEPWDFFLPEKKKVKSFEISALGDRAAFLLNDGKVDQVAVLDLEVPGSAVEILDTVNLDGSRLWESLQVTSRYLMLVGRRKNSKIHRDGCVVDLLQKQIKPLGKKWPHPCEKPTISSRGQLAWIANTEAKIWDLWKPPTPIPTLRGVRHAEFNADGTYLMLWAWDYEGQAHLCAIDVNQVSQSGMTKTYRPGPALPERDYIWTPQSGPACLIQQSSHQPRQYMGFSGAHNTYSHPQDIDTGKETPKPAISVTVLRDNWILTAIRNEAGKSKQGDKLTISKKHFSVGEDGKLTYETDDEIVEKFIPRKGEFRIAAYDDTGKGISKVTLVTQDELKGKVHVWKHRSRQ